MVVRTEEDKLLKAPLVVILGGKEYQIELLVIKDAREWRKKAAKVLSYIPKYANVSTDDAEGFAGAMSAMLVEMPDEMTNLFFEYAKNLDRDEIEATATEAELAKAIEAVMEVAFPLLRSMTSAWGKLAQ